MDAATRDALVWSAVGALTFLVLYLAYRLLGNDGVGYAPAAAIAVAVGALTAGAAAVLEPRLTRRGE